MGKFILFIVLVGFHCISDVAAQPPFARFLMMRQREMAMRRAFPFGFPGSGIPPALAARLAAASGPGMFVPSFGPAFGPSPFGGPTGGQVGPTGFSDGSFSGPSTGAGGPTGFSGMSFTGPGTGAGFPSVPQIPQIPQIPAVSATGTTSTGGAQMSMTNQGTSSSVNTQGFPSIPSQSISFNGRTSEFSTETSPNAIFPSQTAEAPTVVSQRRPSPSRVPSTDPRLGTQGTQQFPGQGTQQFPGQGTQQFPGQGTQQFPGEPMIPMIPNIPSRSTPSGRAPNGMLQFANQGLNVRIARLPPSMTGGRSQAQPSFTRRVGMRGIDFARLASQPRLPMARPGPAAGPAFVTGTDASQNMNIQFRPLTFNQQGQPISFDQSDMQTGLTQPTVQQGSPSSVNMGAATSASQGSTFTVTKEASSTGPAEFQIVKVGSIPEFGGKLGNTVDVKMQGGQAVINGQSSSIETVETVAAAPQDSSQPVGDITIANTAFDAIPDSAGGATDLTASISSGAPVATDVVVDSSATATTSVDSSASTSSVTDQASAITGTETLKLKSPLEATDFSFFAPASGSQQPKEVITLTEAAMVETPTVKTAIPKTETKEATDFKYQGKVKRNIEMLKQVLIPPERLAAVLSGSTMLEFPVQGTALNTPGESVGSEVIFSAPNPNIQTGEAAASSQIDVSSSSNVIVENMSTVGGSASNDFSFFKPPALDVQPIVGNQESVIDSVQLLPTVDNVQSLPTVDSVQSSPVVERVQSLPTVLDPATDTIVSSGISNFQPPAFKMDTLPADSGLSGSVDTVISSDVAPAV